MLGSGISRNVIGCNKTNLAIICKSVCYDICRRNRVVNLCSWCVTGKQEIPVRICY